MSRGFKMVTPGTPCPACGKPDWCAWTPDGMLKCERSVEPPPGMRRISVKDGGAVFVFEGDGESPVARRRAPGSSPHRSSSILPHWPSLVRRFQEALGDAVLFALAHNLGVTHAALRSLGIGLATAVDLRAMGSGGSGWEESYPHAAFTFPERRGDGTVVGLSFRSSDGRKGAPSGSFGARRGLIIPSSLKDLRGPVLIVEGASDLAAAISMGLAAVGRPSNAAGVDDLARLLEGLGVLVVGEHDAKETGAWPGRDGAIKVAAGLSERWGKPIAWALPPESAKDIRSFLGQRLAAGLSIDNADGLVAAGAELLAALQKSARPVHRQQTEGSTTITDGDAWPTPLDLPSTLPPVAKFDPELLPTSVRGYIVDIAERMQCPIDYPAIATMVGLASLIGRKVAIRPKRFDNWTVVCNIWGMVVGRPGVMKTPALQEPLRPLHALDRKAKELFDEEVENAKADKLVKDARKKASAKEIQKHLKNPSEAQRVARESLEEDTTDEPVRRRYVVNDPSVEKLGEVLNQNPNGVLVFRDEIIGFLKSMDKDGQEASRAFYLEAWNGTGSYVFDRIERGTIDIEAAIVSILGGIQPGPLSSYIQGCVHQGVGDDGLLQRFQLLVWPDPSKNWVNHDRAPDSAARASFIEVFEGMDALEPCLVGADHDPYDALPFLHFGEDAQVTFDAWRSELEVLLRSQTLHPALESHLAKFRKLVPAIALIVHLAQGAHGPVSLEALERALGWAKYLETHARRLYAQAVHPEVASASALAGKILAGEVTDGFALRDVYRKGWTNLGKSRDVLGATEVLIDLGWLKSEQVPGEGRTGTVYWINPKILDRTPRNRTGSKEATARTDTSPPVGSQDDPSGGSGGSPSAPSPEISPDGGDWGTL